jgi:hypothetical protein
MRPRQEIEQVLEEWAKKQRLPSARMESLATLQLEVLLDIRDILNKIERDQPLGS